MWLLSLHLDFLLLPLHLPPVCLPLPLPLLPPQRRAAAGAQQEDHGKPVRLRYQRGEDTYDVLYLTTRTEKLKTVLELYDLEIHQKKFGPDYHRLKTVVKRSIEQEIRNKNFGARNGNYERNAVVKNPGDKTAWTKNSRRFVGNGSPTGSVLEETIAVSATISISVEKLHHQNPSPNSFMQQNERKTSRTRSPRRRSPSGRMSRWPCKDYLKGTCTNSFCKGGTLQNACSTRTKSGCKFGEKCSYAHRQVDEQPSKRFRKNDDKSSSSHVEEEWLARKCMLTCCQPWQNSRKIGATW